MAKSGRKSFWCRIGWHKPGSIGFDGCSATSRCIRCGKEILINSQENWF